MSSGVDADTVLRDDRDLEDILAEIVKQSVTGTAITPVPDGWVRALPHLEDVACEWTMQGGIKSSYLWWEDGNYHASSLVSGLEERESRPLGRHEAGALLEGGISHKPVPMEEVQ